MGVLRAIFGPSDPVSSDDWFVRMLGKKTHAGTWVNEHTALQLVAVYAAIGIIAKTLAQLPLDVVQRDPRTRQTRRLMGHPIRKVLNRRLNPHMTAFTGRMTIQQHVLGWGNGYLEVQRTHGGDVVALWPLLPDRTKPVRSGSKVVIETRDGQDPKELERDRVVHLPAMGFDGLVGYSPIWMARQAIGLSLALEEYGGKLFQNEARSGGFLKYPGRLGDEAFRNLKDSWDSQGGLDNAHKLKILEEGMDFIPASINPEDAQFLALRQFQIGEVARLYSVPLHLLQEHMKSTSWGTGLEQLGLGFVQYTLQSWIVLWEQELENRLLTEREQATGVRIKFNVASLLRGDAKSRAEFYEVMIRSGVMTPEEAREKEDLGPLPPDQRQRQGDEARVLLFGPTGKPLDGENDDEPAAAYLEAA